MKSNCSSMKKQIVGQFFTVTLISLLFLTSCNPVPTAVNIDVNATVHAEIGIDQNALDAINNATTSFNNAPGAWQNTMNSLITQLGQTSTEAVSTALTNVNTTYQEALGETEVTGFCAADFIPHRLAERLQIIAHDLNAEIAKLSLKIGSATPESAPAPKIQPVVCSTEPDIIVLGDTQDVKFYGYDFDSFGKTNFTADLVDGRTEQVVKSNFGTVAVSSNYYLAVSISQPDLAGVNVSQGLQLVLKWKGQPVGQDGISYIIVEFPTPIPPTNTPTPTPTYTPTPTPTPTPKQAMADGLYVKFYSLNQDSDGKDGDSILKVTIGSSGSVAQYVQKKNYDPFGEGYTYDRDLTPSSVPIASLEGQPFTVCIYPNGSDKWYFTASLWAKKWVPAAGIRPAHWADYELWANPGGFAVVTDERQCTSWGLPSTLP